MYIRIDTFFSRLLSSRVGRDSGKPCSPRAASKSAREITLILDPQAGNCVWCRVHTNTCICRMYLSYVYMHIHICICTFFLHTLSILCISCKFCNDLNIDVDIKFSVDAYIGICIYIYMYCTSCVQHACVCMCPSLHMCICISKQLLLYIKIYEKRTCTTKDVSED